MQELNDSQLESIAGGVFSSPSQAYPSIGNGSTSANAGASASASGDHSATGFSNAQSFSLNEPNGPSVSLALGYAGAFAS
jgi:hypothetical protein